VDLANRRGISRHRDARGACAALRRCPRPPPADHRRVGTGAGHGHGLRCAWPVRPRAISPVGTSPHGAGNRDSSHVPRRGHVLDRHLRLAVVARRDVHPCRSSSRDLTSSVAGDKRVARLYVEDVRTNAGRVLAGVLSVRQARGSRPCYRRRSDPVRYVLWRSRIRQASHPERLRASSVARRKEIALAARYDQARRRYLAVS